MNRFFLAFLLLACSRPEPRPDLPDLGPTMAILDAAPMRIVRAQGAASRQACDFALDVRCEYPTLEPKVNIRNLDKVARR